MRFVINGVEWGTVMLRSNDSRLERSDGSMSVGVTDKGTHYIYLSDRLYGAFLRKVLIHELCHATMFSYDIFIPLEQEEFLCDFVATYGDSIFDIVESLETAMKRAA